MSTVHTTAPGLRVQILQDVKNWGGLFPFLYELETGTPLSPPKEGEDGRTIIIPGLDAGVPAITYGHLDTTLSPPQIDIWFAKALLEATRTPTSDIHRILSPLQKAGFIQMYPD